MIWISDTYFPILTIQGKYITNEVMGVWEGEILWKKRNT